MKTIQHIIAAAAIGAVLLTGCSKNSSPENDMMTSSATVNTNPTTVTYNLQTQAGNQALVNWEKGYISVGEIFFNGNRPNDNMIRPEKYTGQIFKTFRIGGTSTLGSVAVAPSMYVGISAGIQLTPNLTNTSLLLAGTMMPGNKFQLPVELLVDQALVLNSKWVENTLINQPAYTETILLDLSQMMNGLDETSFQNAQQTNGMIIISGTSNVNLYNIIVSNLQNDLLNMQIAPSQNQVVTNPGNAVAAPAQ